MLDQAVSGHYQGQAGIRDYLPNDLQGISVLRKINNCFVGETLSLGNWFHISWAR